MNSEAGKKKQRNGVLCYFVIGLGLSITCLVMNIKYSDEVCATGNYSLAIWLLFAVHLTGLLGLIGNKGAYGCLGLVNLGIYIYVLVVFHGSDALCEVTAPSLYTWLLVEVVLFYIQLGLVGVGCIFCCCLIGGGLAFAGAAGKAMKEIEEDQEKAKLAADNEKTDTNYVPPTIEADKVKSSSTDSKHSD